MLINLFMKVIGNPLRKPVAIRVARVAGSVIVSLSTLHVTGRLERADAQRLQDVASQIVDEPGNNTLQRANNRALRVSEKPPLMQVSRFLHFVAIPNATGMEPGELMRKIIINILIHGYQNRFRNVSGIATPAMREASEQAPIPNILINFPRADSVFNEEHTAIPAAPTPPQIPGMDPVFRYLNNAFGFLGSMLNPGGHNPFHNNARNGQPRTFSDEVVFQPTIRMDSLVDIDTTMYVIKYCLLFIILFGSSYILDQYIVGEDELLKNKRKTIRSKAQKQLPESQVTESDLVILERGPDGRFKSSRKK